MSMNRLQILAAWTGVIGRPGYSAGEWISEPGMMPWFRYFPGTARFAEELASCQWTNPQSAPYDLAMIADLQAIGSANEAQIQAMLTAIVRIDRFNEGFLAQKLGDGTILAICRRAGVLADQSNPRAASSRNENT